MFSCVQVDADGSGFISVDELGDALKKCNINLPGYQIRDLIQQYDSSIKDGKLDMEEFRAVREKSSNFAENHRCTLVS